MKRQREQPPPAPYSLQLAKYYIDNGNFVLAEHSYLKWWNSLTRNQQHVVTTQSPAWTMHWQLHTTVGSVLENDVPLNPQAQQHFRQMLDEIMQIDYSRADDNL